MNEAYQVEIAFPTLLQLNKPYARSTTRQVDEFQCPWCGVLATGDAVIATSLGKITRCVSCDRLSQFESMRWDGAFTATWRPFLMSGEEP
jgi:hypothetical protein